MRTAILALLLCLGQSDGRDPDPSGRSTVLLRLDCGSRLGRREVTLYANGTVRLRQGAPERPEMELAELDGEELAGYLARIREIDLGGPQPHHRGVRGPWVERCDLEIAAPGQPRRSFSFQRFDSLSLGLARMVQIADDLAAEIEPARQTLPSDYRPHPGDILRRADGARYRVIRTTRDGLGVELRGLDQPLTLFVALEDLAGEFVEVVARRPR